jgi:hypothetical protein
VVERVRFCGERVEPSERAAQVEPVPGHRGRVRARPPAADCLSHATPPIIACR